MEEKSLNSSFKVDNRNMCSLEGVKKLDSFDDKEFLVDTEHGYLHIKGKNLSWGQMDMEKGLLTIKGDLDSFTYMNKSSNKETNFFKKIFK